MSKSIQIQYPGKKGAVRGSENQDSLIIRTYAQHRGTLVGVADGVTNCPFGGSIARWVVDSLLSEDRMPDPADGLVPGLSRLLSVLYTDFKAEFDGNADMLDSACTFSAAWFQLGRLTYAWVGDSPIFMLTPAGKGYLGEMLSRPDIDRTTRKLTDCFGRHAPCHFKVQTRPLPPGSVVVVATDGAGLDEAVLAATLSKVGFTRAWLENLVAPIRRLPQHDDISMVAVLTDPAI